MTLRRKTTLAFASRVAAIAVLLTGPGVIDGAAALPVSPKSFGYQSELVVIGYDIDYLRRNGLEAPEGAMLVDAHGLAAAPASSPLVGMTQAGNEVVITPNGTATGTCGTSTVLATRVGVNQLRIGTSYRLAGVWASEHYWFVRVQTASMSKPENFSGLAKLFTSSWDATRTITLAGKGRTGMAHIEQRSFAIAADGRVCWTLSPTARF